MKSLFNKPRHHFTSPISFVLHSLIKKMQSKSASNSKYPIQNRVWLGFVTFPFLFDFSLVTFHWKVTLRILGFKHWYKTGTRRTSCASGFNVHASLLRMKFQNGAARPAKFVLSKLDNSNRSQFVSHWIFNMNQIPISTFLLLLLLEMVFIQYIIVLTVISKKEIKPFLSVLMICLDLPFLGFMYKLDLGLCC